jgi:thiamine pyrophosphokinase
MEAPRALIWSKIKLQAQPNGEPVSRLRGAYCARPASPDPDNAGGGTLFQHTILSAGWFFFGEFTGLKMSTTRALIFANGMVPDKTLARALVLPTDTIIAANGGTHNALALGLTPSIVIGDLDSLTQEQRQTLLLAGTQILEFPADKNETDLELAVKWTVNQGFSPILVLSALGGRLDQTLGNLALLSDPALAQVDIRLEDGVEEVWFVRDSTQFKGSAGDIVSLLPWGADVAGVRTNGLRWPLVGETLLPSRTRGISNQLLGESASISISAGLLLVVHRRVGGN